MRINRGGEDEKHFYPKPPLKVDDLRRISPPEGRVAELHNCAEFLPLSAEFLPLKRELRRISPP